MDSHNSHERESYYPQFTEEEKGLQGVNEKGLPRSVKRGAGWTPSLSDSRLCPSQRTPGLFTPLCLPRSPSGEEES